MHKISYAVLQKNGVKKLAILITDLEFAPLVLNSKLSSEAVLNAVKEAGFVPINDYGCFTFNSELNGNLEDNDITKDRFIMESAIISLLEANNDLFEFNMNCLYDKDDSEITLDNLRPRLINVSGNEV